MMTWKPVDIARLSLACHERERQAKKEWCGKLARSWSFVLLEWSERLLRCMMHHASSDLRIRQPLNINAFSNEKWFTSHMAT